MLKVALLGHGVVGTGVAELMLSRADTVSRAAGETVILKKILDMRDFSALPYHGLFTSDFSDILGDPEIGVVAECMGGVEPAGEFAKRALEAGKSFVTSNKAMVVARGEELKAIARKRGVSFLYEGSCCGGIPVLRPIRHCLSGNRIDTVGGILNGTTNYILTRMQGGAASFETALREAQQLGYAEANPEADVEGHDARRKLAILASLCFGADLADDAFIPCEGITRVTRQDMKLAESLYRTVRLVAKAVCTDGGWFGRVCPVMLPASVPLAVVSDVFNAVILHGDYVGDAMFYGRGAGREATASAVLGDIVECARLRGRPWDAEPVIFPAYRQMDELTRLFFRSPIESQAFIESAMPEARIVVPDAGDAPGEIAVITHEAPHSELRHTLSTLPVLGSPIRYENA